MKKIIVSVLALGGLLPLSLTAQQEQPFQGVIGKNLNDSKEWWAPVAKPP